MCDADTEVLKLRFDRRRFEEFCFKMHDQPSPPKNGSICSGTMCVGHAHEAAFDIDYNEGADVGYRWCDKMESPRCSHSATLCPTRRFLCRT